MACAAKRCQGNVCNWVDAESMFEFWALFYSGSVLMSMAPYTMLMTEVLVTPVTNWDNVGVKGPWCHWGQGVNCALIASECQNSEALNHINE